jgi:hypothetical protein
MRGRHIRVSLALLAGIHGCTLFGFREQESMTVTTTGVAPSVLVSALPTYRLIVDPILADIPSRLLVLRARIETLGDDTLAFRPSGMNLRLPDGKRARVFDRARAEALLARATLGLIDLTYVQAGRRHVPGGLAGPVEARLKQRVKDELLEYGNVTRARAIEGYLVVDILAPRTSLDGLTLEVVATRVGDAAAARDTYQFAATAAPATR